MPKLWERQEYDTKNSYDAFCDYRDMGKRSLRGLLEQYSQQLVSNQSAKVPSRSLPTIERWSQQCNWQERVTAWDDYQDGLRIEAQAEARKQLIDDELEDYNKQLEKWREAFDRTPLLDRTRQTKDKDGNTTEFIGLNISDLHQLAKWRADIDKQARLALSMPDRYSESKTEVKVTDWRSQAIEDIRAGNISFPALVEAFDDDLATTLFREAGVSIQVTES